MDITKTIKCKITDHSTIFNNTIGIYRDALSFIIDVVNKEWSVISILPSKKRINTIEKFIHETKDNPVPKYNEFDRLFYKFPSYFRRNAISKAIGIVESFQSNFNNYNIKKETYIKEGKFFKDKPPRLQLKHYAFPVLYKGNMFNKISNSEVLVKVYYNNDWIWINANIKGKYLSNPKLNGYEEQNPTLVKSGRKFYLHIPFNSKVQLNKVKIQEQTIVAVDLGLTNSAVCSVIKADGTIIDRLFINQPKIKDQLHHKLGQIKKAQKLSGKYNRKPNYWRKINNYQTQIVNDTASKIIAFAVKHNAHTVVFEYLGKLKGNKYLAEKLQYWAKRKIQNKAEHLGNSYSIRFSRVSPQNTSKLAFDGSGAVIRNAKKDLCTFSNGKQYHSDLNASYNIGSKYFIREILKTFSEKKRLQVEAKVPQLVDRTSRTLDLLINLNKALTTR